MKQAEEFLRMALPGMGFGMLWGLIDYALGRRTHVLLVTFVLSLVAAAVDLGFIQGRLSPRTDFNVQPVLEFTWKVPAQWLAAGVAGALVARYLAPLAGERLARSRAGGGAES